MGAAVPGRGNAAEAQRRRSSPCPFRCRFAGLRRRVCDWRAPGPAGRAAGKTVSPDVSPVPPLDHRESHGEPARLWVIFSLSVLFLVALTFAVAAWGQARRTARANRELNNQIAERERAREALRKANEELRQFAYVAAHDLQEPLRNIRTALGILNRQYGAELAAEARELIAESIDGARRLHEMVKDLLGLATITESLAAPAAAVDSNHILRQVVANFRGEIAARGAEVVAGELPALRVHENHLYQLFHHLIGNALKYARPDVAPSIVIAAERRSSAWSFSVRDNGIGFDPALC